MKRSRRRARHVRRRRAAAALRAARLLVEAYRRAGESGGGGVEWEEIDDAHAAARIALGLPAVDDVPFCESFD